jgi:glycosyltransferase involved in cell wall biosynthesis
MGGQPELGRSTILDREMTSRVSASDQGVSGSDSLSSREPSIRDTVLYVGGFEMPDKNAAAHRVTAVGKIFRDLGYKVVLLGVDKMQQPDQSIVSRQCDDRGFEVWSVPYPATARQWVRYVTSCDAAEFLIERYCERIRAVICYNYPAIAQMKIRNLCRRHGALHISDATEWYGNTGRLSVHDLARTLDTNLRMRLVHVAADGVIATSPYLESYYASKGCVTVELPTLIDLRAPMSRRSSVPGKPSPKKIVYAGSPFDTRRPLQTKRNLKDRLDRVIELFSNLLDEEPIKFKLHVYGITLEDYIRVFPEHRQVLDRMAEVVLFHGRQSHSEVVNAISTADFTVFLRHKDRVTLSGFPTKFSESIALGTPVITNRISNIDRYLIEGKTGFALEFDDQSSQVAKMRSILAASPEAVASMKAYCRSCGFFDYRKFVQPVEEFLGQVDRRVRRRSI